MPNRYIHTIYKEYVNMLNDPKLQEATAGEEVMDQLQETIQP